MRNIDEQLDKIQQEQSARQEDLKTGRIKVVRPQSENPSDPEREKQTARSAPSAR